MKINSNITIKEVQNSDELKEFVMFPHKLYKDSKYWVAPITKEELEVLNKETQGILCFRGPNVFEGYLNNEEKSNINRYRNEEHS